jgi:hypothetical protein
MNWRIVAVGRLELLHPKQLNEYEIPRPTEAA